MPHSHIYQIYYSEETRGLLDPGFIPLDNLRNERPDWREYWPIRNFLRSATLLDDHYYGFFSPKFHLKTRLGAAAVHEFVQKCANTVDVILFSPFFEQSAYYINSFEQVANVQPGLDAAWRQCAILIRPGLDTSRLVMSSLNAAFCNFFVAKAAFWRSWLQKCEMIFDIAENQHSELADTLNAPISHDGRPVPAKVFVIERVASVLLAGTREWTVKAHNPIGMQRIVKGYDLQMTVLDALKIAYTVQHFEEYMHIYSELRQSVAEHHQKSGRGPRE